jgi:hypothetical protein
MTTEPDLNREPKHSDEPRHSLLYPITQLGDKPAHCAVLVYLIREARRTEPTARYKSDIAAYSSCDTSQNSINRGKVFEMFEDLGIIQASFSEYEGRHWLPADTESFHVLTHANEILKPRPDGDDKHRYPEPIADILGSNPRKNLLVMLLEYSQREWNLVQLSRITGNSRKNIEKQVSIFEEYGIVTYTKGTGHLGSTVAAKVESEEYTLLQRLNRVLYETLLSEIK